MARAKSDNIFNELTIESPRRVTLKRQVTPKEFSRLKKDIINIGGKYKRNGFDFPFDCHELITELQKNGYINKKKENQFFATPAKLAQRMVYLAGIEPGMSVFEPSAGHGAILEQVNEICPGADLFYCEIEPTSQQVLSQLSIGECIGEDFTKLGPDKLFDIIIANPPFTKNQDVKHLRKMFDHLNPRRS